MQRPGGERVKFGLVESRRPVRKMGEIDEPREFFERSDRPHRLGRSDKHGERRDRQRLDTALA